MRLLAIFSLSLSLILGGCASTGSGLPDDSWSAKRFYEEAKLALENKNYNTAVDLYSQLEARYPYGAYAEQAQLDTAFAHYRAEQPESAVAAAERFIKLHPRHEKVDYAYYIRGLASFKAGKGITDMVIEQDPADADPSPARDAFRYFQELVQRFPDSRYTQDALQRMLYLRNVLARHELKIADYYLRRGAPMAAANRAKYVLEYFGESEAMPEALTTLAAAYDGLGMGDLAADTRKVLAQSYPDHARN